MAVPLDVAHSTSVRRAVLGAVLAAIGCSTDSAPRDAAKLDPGTTLFQEAASEIGLDFQHFADASDHFRLPEIMGGGVALFDYDGDGDLDAYMLQGTSLDPSAEREHDSGGSRLFENDIVPSGNLAFRDVTDQAGVGFGGYAMGVAVGDYDGDGHPDMYVTALGPNVLLRNRGDGTFESVDGPQDQRWSASASFVDFDRDGDLDLFFVNYVDFVVTNNKSCFAPSGARDYCNPSVYNPVPDRLFRNEGGGRFKDVSVAVGLGVVFGNGLGVTAADFNGDGWQDLYVANDGTENQLWINQEGERFEDRAMLSGTAVNGDGRPEAGMGVLAADFDQDGDEDLLLTHNTLETNTLYLNGGKGNFRDATNQFGLGGPSRPFTGFGLAWADFDHDGWLDAYVANGAVTVLETLRGHPHPFHQEDQVFRGRDGGFALVAESLAWGSVEPLVGRGVAAGDVDLDGDIDLVVANNNGRARLYLNQTGGRRWLRARLSGDSQNRNGIGARIGLRFEDGSTVWRRLSRDGSYLSSNEAVAHFGLPDGTVPTSLEVLWPDGLRERFSAPVLGTSVTLHKGEGNDAAP